MSIAERLLSVRKGSKLTQSDFASSIDVSLSAYKSYERGERDIPLSLFGKLNKDYNTDPVWLFSGEKGLISNAEQEMLENIIVTVKRLLKENKIEIEPAKEAQLIVTLYSQFIKLGMLDEQTYNDIFKLVK